jgi:hypothetical protein
MGNTIMKRGFCHFYKCFGQHDSPNKIRLSRKHLIEGVKNLKGNRETLAPFSTELC